MPYTIDPLNAASPADGNEAGYAAAELRAMKANYVPRLVALESKTAPYDGTKGLPVLNIKASVVGGPLSNDHVLCGDGVWRILTGAVNTVFGRAGDVVAVTGDYTVAKVTGAAPLASPALTGTPTINAIAAGYKGIPVVAKSALYTPVVADSGKCITTSADVNIPDGVFPAGDGFMIYNNSAAAIDLVQNAGLTLRLGGTTSTGDRILSARGIATVWYVSTTQGIITGVGLT